MWLGPALFPCASLKGDLAVQYRQRFFFFFELLKSLLQFGHRMYHFVYLMLTLEIWALVFTLLES